MYVHVPVSAHECEGWQDTELQGPFASASLVLELHVHLDFPAGAGTQAQVLMSHLSSPEFFVQGSCSKMNYAMRAKSLKTVTDSIKSNQLLEKAKSSSSPLEFFNFKRKTWADIISHKFKKMVHLVTL